MTIDNVGELSGIIVAVFGLLGLLYRYLFIPLRKLTGRLKSNSKEIFTSLPVLFAISRQWPLLPVDGSLVDCIEKIKDEQFRTKCIARAFLKDFTYGTFRCDVEGRNIEVNRTYCRYLDVGEEDLLDYGWKTYLAGNSKKEEHENEWHEAFSEGRELEFTIEMRTSKFQYKEFNVRVYPLFNQKHEVKEYFGILVEKKE